MTERQSEVYLVIDEWWKKYGFGPTVDDVMYQLGLRSRNSTYRMMKRLVEMGACKQEKNRARSIRPSYMRYRDL